MPKKSAAASGTQATLPIPSESLNDSSRPQDSTAPPQAATGEVTGHAVGEDWEGKRDKKTWSERRKARQRDWAALSKQLATLQEQLAEARAEAQALRTAGQGSEWKDDATAVVRASTGRPTTYTESRGMDLCAWVSQGKSMRSWCRERGVAMQVVYQWLARQPAFAERYALAQHARADAYGDELIDIADEPTAVLTMEEIQLRKLRIDTRKWVASKLRPQKWGDQLPPAGLGGLISINIGIPQAAKTAPEATIVDVTPRLDSSS